MEQIKFTRRFLAVLMAVCLSIVSVLHAGEVVEPRSGRGIDFTPELAAVTLGGFFNSPDPQSSTLQNVLAFVSTLDPGDPAAERVTQELRAAAQELLQTGISPGLMAQAKLESLVEPGSVPNADQTKSLAAAEKLKVLNYPMILDHLTGAQQSRVAAVQRDYHQELLVGQLANLEASIKGALQEWRQHIDLSMPDPERSEMLLAAFKPAAAKDIVPYLQYKERSGKFGPELDPVDYVEVVHFGKHTHDTIRRAMAILGAGGFILSQLDYIIAAKLLGALENNPKFAHKVTDSIWLAAETSFLRERRP